MSELPAIGDRRRRNLGPVDRFWSKVDRSGGPDACWPWTAALCASEGYGRFSIDNKTTPAHRVAYELLNGPIPDGLVIDHLCRNRACVNPSHMETVTHGENVRRGLSCQLKTHCKRGHKYTPENTRLTRRGHRVCRACARLADARYRLKNDGALQVPSGEQFRSDGVTPSPSEPVSHAGTAHHTSWLSPVLPSGHERHESPQPST